MSYRVLLFDADRRAESMRSRPRKVEVNLGLMKWSRYYLERGDKASLTMNDPDIIKASVVFKQNRHAVDGIQTLYPGVDIEIGGSGYDLHSKLPDEIERLCPDYFLYPDLHYSIGFTSRGCVRKCYFCIVPEKEGRYTRWQHPKEWVRHKNAKLLDNNWYADQDWFFETSQWFIDNNVAVDVTQGMDIRLLTDEIAAQLKKLRWFASIHFAFDDWSYSSKVKDGIEILNNAGIKVRNRVLFLVYCNGKDHVEDAAARADQLKEWNAQPMIMNNIDQPRSQSQKDVYRYCRPEIFWSTGSWRDYNRHQVKL